MVVLLVEESAGIEVVLGAEAGLAGSRLLLAGDTAVTTAFASALVTLLALPGALSALLALLSCVAAFALGPLTALAEVAWLRVCGVPEERRVPVLPAAC